jgi:hypothetical protein
VTDDRDAALVAALDELADAPLDQFVTTRDRLARALKADGRADAAAALRARRRPSVVGWSVHRAARDRPELVAALFDAADDVRAAVERGDGEGLRAAMRAQRTRLGELTDVAVERAASVSPNPRSHAEAIGRTWEAAAGDEALRETVTRGDLVTELRPGATLQGTAPAGAGPPPVRGPSRTRLPRASPSTSRGAAAGRGPTPPRRRDELALRRAEDAVATARDALTEARRAASDARKEHARAAKAVARADDGEARARRQLERAEQLLAERRSR